MKWKISLLLVVLMSIFLSGCNSDSGLEYSFDDFREVNHRTAEIEVGLGEEFRVTLCSNPTTGHVWSNAVIEPTGFVEQVGHQYLGPDGSVQRELVGQAGEEVWRFKAFIVGESTITLDYHQPWEDGDKSTWTYTLTVTVR
jgi:predicted secreted protein